MIGLKSCSLGESATAIRLGIYFWFAAMGLSNGVG